MEEEIWRSVLGYEGIYEVSDRGNIKSIYARSGGRYIKHTNDNGYMYISLIKNGKSKKESVHSIVLEAFIGKKPAGTEGCHNDGDKSNNNLSNLRWGTHLSNIRDKRRHGTFILGEKHPMAKLDQNKVLRIRFMALNKFPHKEIANVFGITTSTVSAIHNKRLWKHL